MNVLTLSPNGLLSFNERKKGNERRESSEFEHSCWVTRDDLTSLESFEPRESLHFILCSWTIKYEKRALFIEEKRSGFSPTSCG